MSPASPSKSGSGLDPRLAATFAYLGGAVTGLVFLAIEKHDRYVRFHAMQSTITFLGVLVLHFALVNVSFLGNLLYVPFFVAVVALWMFLMFKAFKGEMYKLPYVGDLAEQQLKA